MQPPSVIIYMAAFFAALLICVLLHLFIRSRLLLKKSAPASSRSEEMDPANCLNLILDQINLVQTCDHPSAKGRAQVERLAELLQAARLYHPDAKAQLDAFSGRLRGVYDDQGLLLMALMDVKKWAQANLV